LSVQVGVVDEAKKGGDDDALGIEKHTKSLPNYSRILIFKLFPGPK